MKEPGGLGSPETRKYSAEYWRHNARVMIWEPRSTQRDVERRVGMRYLYSSLDSWSENTESARSAWVMGLLAMQPAICCSQKQEAWHSLFDSSSTGLKLTYFPPPVFARFLYSVVTNPQWNSRMLSLSIEAMHTIASPSSTMLKTNQQMQSKLTRIITAPNYSQTHLLPIPSLYQRLRLLSLSGG